MTTKRKPDPGLRKRCPRCAAGNTYVLKDGTIVCRACQARIRGESDE